MNLKATVIGLACVLLANLASADSYQPSPSCSKPYKPYQFNSKWELDNFNNEVDRYKRCIKEFVEEQQQAVENHRSAARDAVDEWNRYVRSELN